MAGRLFLGIWAGALVAIATASTVSAQTADEVKADVLSALSTPLPITIVGPLLTPDVSVEVEGDGFRATLKNTSLMGFLPIGDVSLRLVPLDDDTYRVSDMQLPRSLDFPGIAMLKHGGMELEGTWSASQRSYSALNWVIHDLKVAPEGIRSGALAIGEIAFDVTKEPDEADIESSIGIVVRDLTTRGLAPETVTVDTMQARLAANGEQPVDLYSVIREMIMRSTLRDGGDGLQALGASLLGNTYRTVALDLVATGLNIGTPGGGTSEALSFETFGISAALSDVAPRTWGGAEIAVTLKGLEQRDLLESGEFSVGDATLRLSGTDLPVAAGFEAIQLISEGGRYEPPVRVSDLLDGLAGFGKLELSTEGHDFLVKATTRVPPPPGGNGFWAAAPLFELGYGSWAGGMGLEGLNIDQGKLHFGMNLANGHFTPKSAFPAEKTPDFEALFPVTLGIDWTLSNRNEGLLRKLFTDVTIHDMDEPVEIALPLALYAAATVFESSTGEDVYETALFRVTSESTARIYPTEIMGLFPYEGEMTLRMTGFDRLQDYMTALPRRVGRGGDLLAGISMMQSAMAVMRNLAETPEAGMLEWRIARPDVDRPVFELNGVTLRYPQFAGLAPLFYGIMLGI